MKNKVGKKRGKRFMVIIAVILGVILILNVIGFIVNTLFFKDELKRSYYASTAYTLGLQIINDINENNFISAFSIALYWLRASLFSKMDTSVIIT